MLNNKFSSELKPDPKQTTLGEHHHGRTTATRSTPHVTQIVTHFRLSNAGFSQRNSSKLFALLRLSA